MNRGKIIVIFWWVCLICYLPANIFGILGAAAPRLIGISIGAPKIPSMVDLALWVALLPVSIIVIWWFVWTQTKAHNHQYRIWGIITTIIYLLLALGSFGLISIIWATI